MAGASAINHIQEYKQDALMDRTKHRPLPSGKLGFYEAIFWAVSFLILGFYFLYRVGHINSLILALISVVWYNLIYTPLKKRSAFAVIPGALCGAFPPLIGWLAAGGTVSSPSILVICLFFFIAQIPHFWLLLIIYSKDYKRGGFKVLIDVFSEKQVKRLTLIWMLSSVMLSLMLPAFHVIYSQLLVLVLLFISLWIIIDSFFFFHRSQKDNYRRMFIRFNVYFLLVVVIIGIDSLYF